VTGHPAPAEHAVPGRCEFGILGPLEIRRDGVPLALPAPRARALLVILLVHANRVVSVDELCDELWRDQPPASARSAIQVHVAALRRTLDSGAILRTRAPGYVLEVDDDQLDARRFELGLREATRGEGPGAQERLGDALSLWRGRALAEFDDLACARLEAARLEELRMDALEERVEVDLRLGRHAESIAELVRLTSEHPYRERLHAQLMLALYRSGRQTEALEAYRRARDLLVDELGIEPGEELADLQRAILEHDPALSPPPPDAQRPAHRRPRLPAPPTPFLGRAAELREVTDLLRAAGTRVVTMTGTGGSGKTRLALRAAEICADDYRDGARFVGFADITDPALIAPTICNALDVAEPPDVAPAERLVRALEDRELLLVLDNLEQLARGTAVLRDLLSACPELTLLVTSREPLHLTAERQYEVPVLAPADATELFVQRAQAIVPQRDVDRRVAELICERVDYLPLAIELAAARTKVLSLADILGRLDERLRLLTHGPRDAPRRQRTLRATIDWSYDLLEPDEQRLFARLGVFAGGCTLEAAEAVCGAELDGLHALVDRCLLGSDGARYSMLQTLREYALERLEQSGDANEIRRLHHPWFSQLLDAERPEGLPEHWPPGPFMDPGSSTFAAERENVRAALAWALQRGQWRGWKRP
jgi:predicted ATPase/DNA-binding SARP family transcriptional activator